MFKSETHDNLFEHIFISTSGGIIALLAFNSVNKYWDL
jgi:hypothetical protein